MTTDEIRDRYTYHAPSPDGIQRHARLSELCIELHTELESVCPAGRSLALALTKLEELKMHASAAVARDPATR